MNAPIADSEPPRYFSFVGGPANAGELETKVREMAGGPSTGRADRLPAAGPSKCCDARPSRPTHRRGVVPQLRRPRKRWQQASVNLWMHSVVALVEGDQVATVGEPRDCLPFLIASVCTSRV